MNENSKLGQLTEALEIVTNLQLPEHLQSVALTHLLAVPMKTVPVTEFVQQIPTTAAAIDASLAVTDDLAFRDFMEEKKPDSAVEAATCMLYWAKKEGRESLTEDELHEMFLRAKFHPPKDVAALLRLLCCKQYRRAVRVSGKVGHYALSKIGETAVVFDFGQKKA
ncbi:hypothetical protein M0Q28_01080 [Patescibacteria group bacterium]|jgi:hypothetical protein|nr:hypothetical protein [Patescibacteria group bacterium]